MLPVSVTVRFRGELDMLSAHSVRAQLHEARSRSSHQLVVDLGGVTFMDSSAITPILEERDHARESGRQLELINVPAPVHRLLLLAELHASFGLSEDGSTAAAVRHQPASRRTVERAGPGHPLVANVQVR